MRPELQPMQHSHPTVLLVKIPQNHQYAELTLAMPTDKSGVVNFNSFRQGPQTPANLVIKSDAPVQNLVSSMHTATDCMPLGAVLSLRLSQKRYAVVLNRIAEPESACETGLPGTNEWIVSGLARIEVRFGRMLNGGFARMYRLVYDG